MPISQMQRYLNMDVKKLFEVEDLEANKQSLTSYECLCMCCHDVKTQNCSTTKRHLRQHGRDPYF
jgi:hypothetical protein